LGLAFLPKISQGETMKSNTVGKIVVGLTAWLFVGASMTDCVSDLPPLTNPGGTRGNGGVTANGGNGGGAAGGNAVGGQSAILSVPSSAGTNGNVDAAADAPPVIASADANCGSQTQNPSVQPVDLLLVLDRSGSMGDDIASDSTCGSRTGCQARWPTLTTSLAQVLAASPASVQWGLKFFTSPGGSSCTVNTGVEVGVGPSTAAQIQAAITGTSPGNQTPTMAAIKAAVAYFNTLNDGLPHYILLATDGEPNCDPGTSSSVTDASVMDTAGVIGTANTGSGIKTYVIGIGPSSGNLDAFAAAGGTSKYFPAQSPDALTSAFSTIAGTVASCVFKMADTPPDPTNLGVYLDSTTKVPRDPAEGFSLGADNLTVTLNGSYCDKIKDGTFKLLQVFFGCAGVPLPDNF
jgi:hypothetical protein